MQKYDSLKIECDNCDFVLETPDIHDKFKLGPIDVLCDKCDGNLVITNITTHIYSEYELVQCMICKTQEIVHTNVIGSNRSWICPNCGDDGGSFSMLQEIFYHKDRCTNLKKLFQENQSSLDIFMVG
jgi:ssDNA-binding Zn-finger/Zn-ribbon topoisomerase 1